MGEVVQVKRIILVSGQMHEEGTAVLEASYIKYNFQSEGRIDYVIPWSQVVVIELQ